MSEKVKEFKPKKVVHVGTSIALIVPPEWRKQFEQIGDVYGVWRIVTSQDGKQRIEVRFQKGK